MQLTTNFTLAELSVSDYAARHGIDMTAPPAVQRALKSLCEQILEPLRKRAGRPVLVSSGYRPANLNAALNGAKHSQHILGQAADINIHRTAPINTARLIIATDLPFDQLIMEFGQWVHVSFNPNGPQRGEVLTASRVNGVVHYTPGL